MRIVIDLQGAQTGARFRGIGRYSVDLAKAIIRNRREHEIILALNGFFPETVIELRKTFDELLPQDHIRVWEAPLATLRAETGSIVVQRQIAEVIYAHFIASLSPDLLLMTSVIEKNEDGFAFTNKIPVKNLPIAIVEYDLIPYMNPSEFLPNKQMQKWYFGCLKYLEEASLVLSISNYSRAEFIEQLDADPEKVVAIGTDASSEFYPEELTENDHLWLKKHGIARPFLLYAGGAEDRKNTDSLLLAYSKLPPHLQQRHQIVFVCGIHDFRIKTLRDLAAKNNIPAENIVLLGYLTTDELRRLYNACKLFAFPSLYEGFGLTPLEAMRCGAPVIGSNTTSIPEVIGNEEALFAPTNVDSIAQKMTEVLSDDAMLMRLKEHSRIQQGKFSWDITASRCLNAFEKLVSTPAPHSETDASRHIRQVICDLKPLIMKDVNPAQVAYDLALTFDPPRKQQQKTLFVDISELVSRDAKTGIQRVVRSILSQLLNNPPAGYKVQPVYATKDSFGYLEARQFTHYFTSGSRDSTIKDQAVDYHSGDFFLGLDFQSHIVSKQALFISQMAAHGVKVWFVIYDLLPVALPTYFLPGMAEGQVKWLHVISHYDGVICISKAVADDYAAWFKKNKPCSHMPRVKWFHIGSDITASIPTQGLPEDASQVLAAMRARPTFLMVSTIEPRKGYAQAFAAFEQLWQNSDDVNLVIVGKQGWQMEKLTKKMSAHKERGKRFFWLQGISDEYLEEVYDAATAVIMASEGEGFGLAVVEGARHGKPLILRDIPVFREIAGEHAVYFDGTEPESLAATVREWLRMNSLGKAPSSESLGTLTWEESAKMLIERLPLD